MLSRRCRLGAAALAGRLFVAGKLIYVTREVRVKAAAYICV